MKFFICCSLLICACAGFPGARAASLLYEPFDYQNGPLVTVSAGKWITHSGTSAQAEVAAGRLDLQVPETEDVSAVLAGQPYAGSTNTVLFASFTLKYFTLPSAAGQYFMHFKGAGTSNFRAKVFALTSGDGAEQYRIGIAGAANSAVVTNAVDLDLNTDYRVYVRYVVSNAMTTLWVDPLAEASPSVTAMDATAASSLSSLALRQDSGLGVLQVDDIRVGTAFADVYQVPVLVKPTFTLQPVNTSAIEGGSAVFTAAANGSAPRSYQWVFHGTNLPGATNTTLTLNHLTLAQAGPYSVTVTNAAGTTNSATATLTVFGATSNGLLTVVHYNIQGLFSTNWSTNAPKVQAIARQLQYLNPDIIALNEIRNGFHHEMTNWMTAFFPTYSLAVSPGTDNSLRSGFISRYPITRSQSWLDGVGLTNFGFAGEFTRDLFEAEITVPGATEPLHIFTTHLKSGPDADSQDRRAAECSAVSNFFATVFVPANGQRPYLLTGDLNEDIDIAQSHGNQPIQRLISPPTGLTLTTPLNPFTLSPLTHSIQGSNSLDARIDYVMPAGVLSSNLVTSQVFRTDLLNPVPLNLNSNDNMVASDHLPVVMSFRYPDPPLLTTLSLSNTSVVLNWPTLVGRRFIVESSTNLTTWTVTAADLMATSPVYSLTIDPKDGARFFRVQRLP